MTRRDDTATNTPAGTREAPAAGMPGNRRKRSLSIGLLIAVASLLLGVSIFATWVDRVALDSTTWSDAAGQSLQSPAVRTAVANYLVDQLYANIDVPKALSDALPAQLRPLAGTIAATAQPYLERALAVGLGRPEVVKFWTGANLRAHQQLMHILDGGGSSLSTANGTVSLDLRPYLAKVSGTLAGRTGQSASLPPNAGKIVLLQSDQLHQAQVGVKVLRMLSIPLGLISLGLYALAVFLSRDRRRTLRATSFGVLAVGLVLVITRRVVGDLLINSLTTSPDVRAAGHAIWWIATDRLGNASITAVSVGVLLLAGATLAGPGRRATASRKALTPYLREPAILWAAYGGLVLLLLVWAPVNAARDPLVATILIVLGAAGLQAIRTRAVREFPDELDGGLGHVMARAVVWSRGIGRSADSSAATSGNDRYGQLERIAELHQRGVLDDQEYAAEKASVLSTSQ